MRHRLFFPFLLSIGAAFCAHAQTASRPPGGVEVDANLTAPVGEANGGNGIAGLFSAAHLVSTVDGKVRVKDFVNIDRNGKITAYAQGTSPAGQECYLLASGGDTNATLQGRTLVSGKSPQGDPDYETKIGDDTFGILVEPDNNGELQWFFHMGKPDRTIKVRGAGHTVRMDQANRIIEMNAVENAILISDQFYGLSGNALTSPTLTDLLAMRCADGVAIGNLGHARYVIKGGEVYDKKTNLTWQRCSVGQQWTDGTGCIGTTQQFSFDDAQKLANGNWRLPTKDELGTLIDYNRADRQLKPTIDVVAFPDIDMHKLSFWSSTVTDGKEAWIATFFGGRMFHEDLNRGSRSVRLVRNGQ